MSWKKVKIGDILTESRIVSENPNDEKRIRVRLNANGVEKRPLMKTKGKGTKYFIRKQNQFIYGKQNLHKGAFGIVPPELDGYESSADIPSFDIKKSCLPKWINYYFKQGDFYKKLEKIATGTGSRRIQPKRLFEVEIIIPDKDIQEEILKKCENYENLITHLQTETQTQKQLLTQLRKAILQEAVQGKLVPQVASDEPATELLQRIKTQKAQLVADKKIRKPKYLPPITADEQPFELPNGWVWCRLGEVSITSGGIQKTPKRTPIKNPHPYLRVANVQRGSLNLNEIKYFELFEGDLERWKLKKQDLLIVEGNGSEEEIGISAIWNNEIEDCVHQNHIIRSRFLVSEFSIYMLYYLNSPIGRENMKAISVTTTGLFSLSVGKINKISVALPPLAEQKRIVSKVEQLLAYCDALEKEIAVREKDAATLMQAVLQEAFEA